MWGPGDIKQNCKFKNCETDWSGDTDLRLIVEKANFANGRERINDQSFGQERLEFLEFLVKDW